MSDVNAIINIDINSSSALINLKRLESQIDQFNRSVSTSNATAAASQQGLNKALLDGINNTGLFNAKVVPVESSMKRFASAIDAGNLSLSEYTRSAASQLPGMSRIFKKEFDTIEQVATSRVKSMQTQYLALGKTVEGVTKTIASAPIGLSKGLGADLAVAQQRQQLFNKLLDDGSTKLLNFGKNTQWAGRQLMVGFSLPLAAFGAVAAKTFMEIDKATVSLKRVYGDLSTTKAELDSNVEAVKGLGKEYTKYGITLSETISLSARAAATGATNESLMAATEQTLRFATLGQIDYNQALDTTISLQTAFAISNEDLGKTIDYLNAVENQTILTMEDMSLAIPRVATVVKGLGGSVEDLAIMMTAMREGGVSAENAANGLKSGLASLINPTNRASESLASMGVNLNSIITQNKGDLMGIITEFGTAINKLDEFSRQQVLEQVFGKYQYARMSALFTNITKDSGQAARAMDIAAMSAADLSKIAEKELGQISDSTSVKFQAAMEQLKISIAPIGEAFLKGITPVVNMVSKIAEAFNNLPDGVKNAIAVVTAVVAGLGPVFLMTIGLLGNGLANLVKGFQFVRKMIAGVKGDASAFTYLSQKELEAVTASKALEGSAVTLTDKLLLQRGAVSALTAEYQRFASAAGIAGASMGRMGGAPAPSGGGRRPLPTPRGFAAGGIVPGTGNGDTIPALLTPGESVITKKATQKYAPILQQMNDGTLPGFAGGFIGQFKQASSMIGGLRKSGSRSSRMSWEDNPLVNPYGRMERQNPQTSRGSFWKDATLPQATREAGQKRKEEGKVVGHIYSTQFYQRHGSADGKGSAPRSLGQSLKSLVGGGKLKEGQGYDLLANQYIIFPESFNKGINRGTATAQDWILSGGIQGHEMISLIKSLRSKGIPEKETMIIANKAARTINARVSKVNGNIDEKLFGEIVTGSTIQSLKTKESKDIFNQLSIPLSSGRVSIGKAIQSWQTSSRSVREDPQMLGALMSGMRPSQSTRTLTRGTTLGLSRGSEFNPADERMIMDALRSGNIDSIIGRKFDMRGPISYTSGNSQGAINAMSMNTDVNRIRELKRQHAEAKQTHVARLKRIETLKKKIETGKGPISTYQRQLEELEGFVSMYAAGQKARGREIKTLTSRGYEDLLIEQRFNAGDQLLDVNAMNPSGTFMGKDVSKESEFISSGSRVRVSGVTTDPNTGLTKLVLENIVDNVQRRASGGPIVPGSGSGDTVPAMLTPGEFVINKQATQSNLPLLHAINNGQTVKKNKGGMIDGVQYLAEGDEVQSRRGGYSYRGRENISQHVATIIDPAYRAIKERELEAARRGAVAAEEMAKSLGATSGQLLNIAQIDRAHTVGGVDKSNPEDWTPDKWMPQIGAENQLSTILAQSDTNRAAYLDHLKKIGATESEISSISHKVTSNIGLTSSELQVQSRVLQSMFSNSQDMARMSPSFELFARSTVASAQARAQAIPSPSQIIPGQRSFMEQGMISGGITEDSVLMQQEKRQSESRRAIESSRKARLAKETRAVSSRGVAPQAAAIIALKNIRAKDQEDAIRINEELDALQEQVDVPEIDDSEDPRRRGSRNRRAKFGRGAQMGGGAMMMASMAPMMMANQEGKFMGMDAGALTGGLMGAGMLAEFAPIILSHPIIAGAALGAAALGGAFYAWRKHVDDAAKKTAELGANMGGTANALNNMATLLGTSTPAQRQAQMQLGFTAEQQQQAASQFQPMFESEAGQKFIKDLESATSADRFKKLSDYLKSAIASGMMDKQSANLFAKTIASTLSDPVLGQAVIKSISGQKAGGAAMLELAQKRESGVIAGGQLKVLGANQTVEEGTASSVIGSSIQLIQDFSNAAALAKEEFVAGTVSYSKYKEIIDQSTVAQEKYTQAIENSFMKTEDFGATMQAWKDQLTLAGFSPEIQEILEKSATTEASSLEKFLIGGKGQAVRELLGGNATASSVGSAFITGEVLNKQLMASITEALASGMNPTQVAAIAEEVNTNNNGMVAQTLARTGDMGLAGLQYNLQQNAVPGLAFTSGMTDREKATTARGHQQYLGAAEKFTAAGFSSQDFQQVTSMVGEKNIIDLSFQLSGMSESEIGNTVKQTQELNKLIGPEGSTKIMDIVLNENPLDLNTRLRDINLGITSIMENIPDDVQKRLGINVESPYSVDEWKDLASGVGDLIPLLDKLPQGIRQFGIDMIMDENGKTKSAKEFLKNMKTLSKDYEGLSSDKKEVRKQSIISFLSIAKDSNGNLIEDPQAAYEDLKNKIDKEFGAGTFEKLPTDTYLKIIDLQTQVSGIEKLKAALAIGETGGSINAIDRFQEIVNKGPDVDDSILAAAAEGVDTTKDTKGGGGGGGTKANPLLDLKKSILEQIKMYVDINATMKKLNDQKYKFADMISGKGGVLNRLRGLKGNAGGLSDSVVDAISAMGPDAAKKWIKKNTKDGKLTKEGQNQADLLNAGKIRGTIEGNLAEFRGARAQRKAYRNLRGRGLDNSVVQAIAGDPEKAKELEVLQARVNAGLKGSVKNMNAFINSQIKATKQAELLARAQDPLQTKIDDLTMAHRIDSVTIDKQIKIYEDQITAINKEITAIQELNSKDQNRIRDLDRQKEMINRQIEALSRANELDQRRADSLKREDEIRNRTADAIGHQLDIMSQQETKIRDAYDKRIKALDEVAKINDYIIGQQKSQLGLAQALSQGDVYAAAAAQQEMQAGSSQFAQSQMRAGLQTGMENQVAGLTTAGGLTRDQAEAQIAAIKEQSYQTSLLIRDIEDTIYNRNLQMIPLKDDQLKLDTQIQVIQDDIYKRETLIIGIQDGKLANAQKQLDKELEIKTALDDKFDSQVADYELQKDIVNMIDAQSTAVAQLSQHYKVIAEQIDNINKLAAGAKEKIIEPIKKTDETETEFNERYKKYQDRISKIKAKRDADVAAAVASMTPVKKAVGGLIGDGARDSIPAMLTPGEFVMRKASVQKYGMPMLSSMNMGAFDMPRYDAQQPSTSVIKPTSNTANINAPVYNTYSVNVSANTNASADDIASTVITKIRNIENSSIRRISGY